MVEFGLKLEDNKVSAWSDKYVNYDRLKQCLRRGVQAMQSHSALMKRLSAETTTPEEVTQYYWLMRTNPEAVDWRQGEEEKKHQKEEDMTSLDARTDRTRPTSTITDEQPPLEVPTSVSTALTTEVGSAAADDDDDSEDFSDPVGDEHSSAVDEGEDVDDMEEGVEQWKREGNQNVLTASISMRLNPSPTNVEMGNIYHSSHGEMRPLLNGGIQEEKQCDPKQQHSTGAVLSQIQLHSSYEYGASSFASSSEERYEPLKEDTGARLTQRQSSFRSMDSSATPPWGFQTGRIPSMNSFNGQRSGAATTSTAFGQALEFLETRCYKNPSSPLDGFLGGVSVKSRLKESLRNVDISVSTFSLCIQEELDKVNTFYNSQLSEAQHRLDVLVKDVETLRRKKQFYNRTTTVIGGSTNSLYSLSPESVLCLSTTSLAGYGGSEGGASNPEDNKWLGGGGADRRKRREKEVQISDSVRRDISDIYRTVKLLCNFSIMNYTGFVRIVHKFDRAFPRLRGTFRELARGEVVCREGVDAELLAERMEEKFAQWFCKGNLREARAQLMAQKADSLELDWSHFRLGYRLGMCTLLGVWLGWDCVWDRVTTGSATIGGRTAFPVFRACGGLLLLHWFWGLSVLVWSRHRINYVFLFEFDPRVVNTPVAIFNDAVDETLVFLICMLLYYKDGLGPQAFPQVLPPGAFPFFLILYTLKCLIFPLSTRVPMWRAVWKVVTAPMTSPTFFHTFMADVFTSMVKVFQDILWSLCFVVSGDFLLWENRTATPHAWKETVWYRNVAIPLICLFPLCIRFNQCIRRYIDTGKRWPNIANAFKYAMSQTVTLFGAFHPLYLLYQDNGTVKNLDAEEDVTDAHSSDGTGIHHSVSLFQCFWIGVFISSSLYSFYWDVYNDWGLGWPKYGLLGPRLMFPKVWYYYGVMVLDLILRFMWVLTLVPPSSGSILEIPYYLTFLTMSLELFRRTVWGFFRLENEHRCNTEGYRLVDFVPLHFQTGHDHFDRAQSKKHEGQTVLVEVVLILVAVTCMCAGSVAMAERANQQQSG